MLAPVSLPPGIYANGTVLQSQGRWRDGNLIRFYEGQVRPVGGYRKRSLSAVSGAGREIVTWRDNANQIWAGVGTHSGLFSMTNTGVVAEITPAGFSSGAADAVFAGGYGSGSYGVGSYGLPIVSTSNLIAASVWSLDTWGERLVGCMAPDKRIFEWVPNTAAAVPIANAPTARALLVTGERIIMALGANDDPRAVAWCDPDDNTVWASTSANLAGDYIIATKGELICGVVLPGGALLFTETDCHRARFVGAPAAYAFEIAGDGSGAISQNAVQAIDGKALWMGPQGFWTYSGFVQPLPCEVSDYVFSNLNRAQVSKIASFHNSSFGEVWWFYPDQNATENNRYVAYSYRENHWSLGELDRLCADDRSPFPAPLAVGSDGFIYEHEVGSSLAGHDVFLESGPFEFQGGGIVVDVLQSMPDEKTIGDLTMTLFGRYETKGAEHVFGPYPGEVYTDMRASGRQFRLRVEAPSDRDWRYGVPKFEVQPGGMR